ncbi:hypothetical protein BDC45DRAFT_427087, partial [Circinella umbellata]
YIPVFFFLVKIFNKYDYKGPYIFMEKGLLILYHLITGNSFRDMEDFIPSSSFHEIYKQFWDDNKNELNRLFTELLENINFMFPIRKNKNEELTDDEILYNETFGSFRSKIENYFGILGNKFKRFNNNERNCKITDIKTYNIQLKLVLLLLNIKKFVDIYNIPIKPNHILWSNENFNYPNPNKEINNII